MKKLLILVLLITLFGCEKEKTYDELGNEIITDQEVIDQQIADMINVCINAYNDDKIAEIQSQMNKYINPKPIEVGEIKNIESLKELSKETDPASNANYIYRYHLDDKYSIVFRLFEPYTDFWLDATATFEVDTLKVTKNNPEYASIKDTLDNLLVSNKKAFDLLFGVGVEKGNAHPEKEGYFEVVSFNDHPITSIDQIKEYASQIFSQELLDGLYVTSFDCEDPIYIEENNKLYIQDAHATTQDGLPYDTSLILAVEETDKEVKVDILAGYGENIIPQVFRINLVKENGKLLLNEII